MTQENTPSIENAEQEAQWAREQFQKANRFLAEKGIVPDTVKVDESRFLAPLVAVWKLKASAPKGDYWVISGDVPTDCVEVKAAQDAREAMRYFSLQWQLKAQNLVDSGAVKDPTQAQFAQLLVSRAQGLYELYEDEKVWTNETA
ncbi:DUF4826 family protein [Paraferrimonas sedimenticola]|uniref:DUF4826 domain-containing protein n=1 Tax=Paraferrimonas sedimenticola TaxID=375674 RepID=A0AA37W2I9_9GAMM|nr:DUF4826 family protein [Paraferrimonas sedimenticola]GLP97857.1 DUF4826 domain-containing protein [Paraferrimonas sedimenticola]